VQDVATVTIEHYYEVVGPMRSIEWCHF